MAARRGARPGRLASILVAITVLVAVLGSATMAIAQEMTGQQMLDLFEQLRSGPVFEQECSLCHANIAQTKTKEIIFSHGMHIMRACSACHPKFPHQPGGTATPKMDVCFDCHGLNHGPRGNLATGLCVKCHMTKIDKLRPAFHTADWKGKPHVAPSLKQLNTKCAMCHTLKQCDVCHIKEGITWKPEKPMAYDSANGCLACHGDQNLYKSDVGGQRKSFQVQGLYSSAHKSLTCQQCHVDFKYIEGPDQTKIWAINAGLACAGCHDHEKVTKTYYSSVHGQKLIEQMVKGENISTAVCSSCHGGHYIQRYSKDPVAKAELHAAAYRVCARCHKEKYESYDDYYHGAAYKRGAADAPACWDCHG